MSEILANALEVKDVRKIWLYLTLVASFEMKNTDRLVIAGRSGLGKTSFLRLLAGLEHWNRATDQGLIRLDGIDLTGVSVDRRQIGFLFQEAALFSGMSVLENVSFGLKVRGVKKAEREFYASEWLGRVGMKARADSKIDQLSGGERQRVAIARTLIIEPKLLLLDEPFTGLDPALKKDLISQLLELHRARPIPVLMVTHDDADAREFGTGELGFEERRGASFNAPSPVLTIFRKT